MLGIFVVTLEGKLEGRKVGIKLGVFDGEPVGTKVG